MAIHIPSDKEIAQFNQLYPVSQLDPNEPLKPIDWLIEGLLQRGKINGITGLPKSGKSRVLGWLLCGMSLPSVLGLRVVGPAPRLLYLLGEETKEVVTQRIARYSSLLGMAFPSIHVMEAASLGLQNISQRSLLLNRLQNYDGLIIDTLRRVHDADENDSSMMAPIMNSLRFWSNHYGKTVILLHHMSKPREGDQLENLSSWFRGSSDIAAILDVGILVNRMSAEKIQLRRDGRFAPLEHLYLNDKTDEGGFFHAPKRNGTKAVVE